MPRKPCGPRRKRMKRQARLESARHWLPTFSGKHIVKSYARWFGVDLGCALKELQMLDVPLDPKYVATLQRTIASRTLRIRQRKPEKNAATGNEGSDEHFAFIAGYTEGGFAYGITWEEAEGTL